MRLVKLALCLTLFTCAVVKVAAQATEQRTALTEAAVALDAKGAPAIEARLLTTMLNGSQDSPVTNVRIVVKNTGANSFTYVSGWATFYDSAGVRCGEGLFKVDALAPNESAETDTPGLRLRCSPATWRVVATNLLKRSSDTFHPAAPPPPPPAEPAAEERRQPVNFIIIIDGDDHPIPV